jgi:hypothetical protein
MLLLCSTLSHFLILEYLLKLFENRKLSNEKVWICVKIELSGLRQTSLQHIGFCFLNVTNLTQGFNVAMLSLDMNTKINSKKKT